MNANEGVAESLNFGWLVEGEIAGCAGPISVAELQYLKSQGVASLVRLAHPDDPEFTRFEESQIISAGLQDLWVPVPDFTSPTEQQIDQILGFVERQRANGGPVAVSCGAGCGRSGTILACYLITRGYDADAALRFLISKRPCCREIVDGNHKHHQKDTIFAFEKRFTGRRPDL